MLRYRHQARREILSFFILDWSLVRLMPRRAAAPEAPQSPHGLPAAPPGIEGLLIYLFQVVGEVFKQLNASYREKE